MIRSALTGLAALALVVTVGCSDDAPEAGPSSAAVPVAYEVTQTWTIPNGGSGKAIVIPVAYLNDGPMAALGEKLKNDTKGDRNAVIMIYADAQAARLRDQVLAGGATPTESALYDKHFIGTYVRNANTGFHALEVCYGGFVPSVDCHNTKY